MPSGKPGKFSTSCVVVSCAAWRPGCARQGGAEGGAESPAAFLALLAGGLAARLARAKAHLAARRDAVGHPAFQHDGVEQRASRVDCRRVASRPAAHDAHFGAQLLQRRGGHVACEPARTGAESGGGAARCAARWQPRGARSPARTPWRDSPANERPSAPCACAGASPWPRRLRLRRCTTTRRTCTRGSRSTPPAPFARCGPTTHAGREAAPRRLCRPPSPSRLQNGADSPPLRPWAAVFPQPQP